MKSRRLRPIVKLLCGCTKRWIVIAPSLPAAIASIANLGPVYTSPPTKMSGSDVWYVSESATALPALSSSTFVPANKSPQTMYQVYLDQTARLPT